MNKTIIVALMAALMCIGLASATATYWCYQESADTANQTGIDGSCGQVYDGSYAAEAYNYLYVNYTVPQGVTTWKWQVLHGNWTVIWPNDTAQHPDIKPYNISSEDMCAPVDGKLILRFYANDWGGGSESVPQCYNGTEWINIGQDRINTYYAGCYRPTENNIPRWHDGDWMTQVAPTQHEQGWAEGCGYSTPTGFNSVNIYEEAMYWGVTVDCVTDYDCPLCQQCGGSGGTPFTCGNEPNGYDYKNECPVTYTFCEQPYLYHYNGKCAGGSCGQDQASVIADGNICFDNQPQAPTAQNNCQIITNCTEGQTTANVYYQGYYGFGCTDINQVQSITPWTASEGTHINETNCS